MHEVHILVPAQRYVFALDGGEALPERGQSSADGFRRYKELQAEGKAVGPVTGALSQLGVEPHEVRKVILTHLHFDHAEGLAAWPQRTTYVHHLETEAPYALIVAGQLEAANLEILEGDEGEIEQGLSWIRTPGHCDGLISLLVEGERGLIVIASDCVGPLPEYFDQMDLPQDFGPERDELLEQWRRIRELDPYMVIPGHYPPVTLH
jgi:N-acyl homoserine lactone hydrolase